MIDFIYAHAEQKTRKIILVIFAIVCATILCLLALAYGRSNEEIITNDYKVQVQKYNDVPAEACISACSRENSTVYRYCTKCIRTCVCDAEMNLGGKFGLLDEQRTISELNNVSKVPGEPRQRHKSKKSRKRHRR